MSRILKPADDGTSVSAIQVFDLRPVRDRAREIVTQAEQTLADARREAEAIREAAKADGFEQGRTEGREVGRKEGIEEGLARAGELVTTLTAMTDAIDNHRAALVADAEGHLAALAVAVAERIVKARVEADPAVVTRTVAEALALTADADRVRITAAPDDIETIRAFLPALGARADSPSTDVAQPPPAGKSAQAGAPVPQGRHVTLAADPGITRGGCVVTTAGGEVDARIETQLDRLQRQLTGRETETDAPERTT